LKENTRVDAWPRQAMGAYPGDVAEDESKGPAGCVPT